MVVLPTPPLPITMMSPWPLAASASARAASGSACKAAPAAAAGVAGGTTSPPSKARRAGRPTVSKARRGTSSRGSCARASGIWPMASRPRRSMASATGSCPGWLARNTPLMARRWLASPRARSSTAVRAASCMGRGSGRVTSTTVVSAGLLSAARAALKRASCIFSPECGPRQEAPRSLPAKNPVQALGKLSRRSVWPVGAVSNTTWSKVWSASAPSLASRAANSSNAAISVVQAPESCSRTVARSSSVAVASSCASTRWR